MISLKELNPHNYPTTPEIDSNLQTLLSRLNSVRSLYGKPLTITSGLRSEAQQQGLIKDGKSTAVHSKHLIGAAADILDEDALFYAWCKANPDVLKDCKLWCEERQGNWQHLQIYPPKSGKLWFIP